MLTTLYKPGPLPGFIFAISVARVKVVRKNVQGTVIVQFIVEKDGSLSNIEAISGPEILWDAATKVLKDSPNWKPAYQYGRKVKSYKKQPISFRLSP